MRIGSLCSGFGGLDHAVEEVFDATTAWVSDIDKGACKILAHRYPDVPNIGDMTTVDWATLEPVDIVTAGYPCQPFSHAGRRKGTTDVRHLWPYVRKAVRVLRPRFTVLENVAGHRSLGFDRVLGDLAEDGMHVRWTSLRAADIGAPHGRERLFFIVTHSDSEGRGGFGWQHSIGRDIDGRGRTDGPRTATESPSPVADAADLGHHQRAGSARGRWAGPADGDLLPTPRATDGTKGGPNQRGSSGDLMLPSAVALLGTPTSRDWKDGGPQANVPINGLLGRQVWALLPTPAVNDMGAGKTVEDWDAWTDDMKARHGNGNGHGKSLSIEAQRLLPTPRASDGPDPSSHGRTWSSTDNSLHTVAKKEQWGDYAAAIARWERVLGRPAPSPTRLSAKGNPQLAADFCEWMMGLPAGWVTDVPGITRNEALKALGNGVVPQQAVAALRTMLAWEAVAS